MYRHSCCFSSQDIEIENIGKGVDDLHELAKIANEEVKLQTKMLETLEAKIDDVHDHVTNVNSKLKTTLDEARKSDKICMVSICCICRDASASTSLSPLTRVRTIHSHIIFAFFCHYFLF